MIYCFFFLARSSNESWSHRTRFTFKNWMLTAMALVKYAFYTCYNLFLGMFGHLRTSTIFTHHLLLPCISCIFFLSWVFLTGGHFAFCQSYVSLIFHSGWFPPESVQFFAGLFAENVALLLHRYDMSHNSLPGRWKRVWRWWHPCIVESSGPLFLV